MEVKRLSETLIEIDGRVRCERGPLMKTAIASAALFAGKTLPPHYQMGARDKLGAVIVDGQEFTYLDWNAPHVWHVYEYCTEAWTGPNTTVCDEHGEPILDENGKQLLELGPAWRRRDHRESELEAAAVAMAIIGGAV